MTLKHSKLWEKTYMLDSASSALPRHLGLAGTYNLRDTGGYRTIDGRTTRHPGYSISQRIRKRVEEVFGWVKTVGGGGSCGSSRLLLSARLRQEFLRKWRFDCQKPLVPVQNCGWACRCNTIFGRLRKSGGRKFDRYLN